MLTKDDLWIDAKQGTDRAGRPFGYIGTEEKYVDSDGDRVTYCGWFFTWSPDRDKMVESMELDETENHRESIPLSLATELLRDYLRGQ